MNLKIPEKEEFSLTDVIRLSKIGRWSRAVYDQVADELRKMGYVQVDRKNERGSYMRYWRKKN